MPNETTARLIAEMIESQAWSIPNDCSDHPILGPALAIRRAKYGEMRRHDFTEARLAADTAAIQFIIDSVKDQTL